MVSPCKGKRIVVLSDHDLILRAIELSLNGCLEADVVRASTDLSEWPGQRAGVEGYDLIVVAVSSPSTEPVVALVRSSLVDRVGRVPLLIISDRPFEPVPEAKISHLRFPFEPVELQERVERILQGIQARG